MVFRPFTRLPSEIRYKIWMYAIEECRPKKLFILQSDSRTNGQYVFYFAKQPRDGPVVLAYSTLPPMSLAHACYESRELALSAYCTYPTPITTPPPPWADFSELHVVCHPDHLEVLQSVPWCRSKIKRLTASGFTQPDGPGTNISYEIVKIVDGLLNMPPAPEMWF